MLVVEGLFVPRSRSNGVISLAESAVLVYGPLLDGAEPAYRPQASVWRPVVLGLRRRAPRLLLRLVRR